MGQSRPGKGASNGPQEGEVLGTICVANGLQRQLGAAVREGQEAQGTDERGLWGRSQSRASEQRRGRELEPTTA